MRLLLFLAILGVTCNAQQRVGDGSGGPGIAGKAKSDFFYHGTRYHDAQIDTFGETTVTIISLDGSAQIPVNALPMRLQAEHRAWLQAELKEKRASQSASAPQPVSAVVAEPRPPAQGWQAAAVQKYPELGIPGSAFNKRFVEEVAERRKTTPGFAKDPKWPMLLADELAEKLESPEAKKARLLAETEAKLPQFKMEAKILQLTGEGALVTAAVERNNGMVPMAEPVFVFGISNTIYVDGDPWNGTAWLAGNYRYTATSGGTTTLRSFSTNRDDAIKRIRTSLNINLPDEPLRPAEPRTQNGNFAIIQATYGGGNVQRDVTRLIQEQIRDSRIEFGVENEKLGGDPIFGEVKTLYVRYRAGGKILEISVKENETLRLP